MDWVAELLLLALLIVGGLAAVGAAAFALWLAGHNLVMVLISRKACHGTLQHPAKAHRGDSMADRYAQDVPPLWRQLLVWPPLRAPR